MIFPALIAALTTVAGGVPPDEGGKLDFKTRPRRPAAVHDRLHSAAADPVARPTRRCANCRTDCTARSRRTIRPWCAAPATTRARNSPASGRRRFSCAATRRVTCRSAPTRGAARRCPYGTPSHDDPRNDPAAEQVPVHSAGGRYDPGPPVVQLPPGVAPGPGPAPHAPFPLPVPPNDTWAAAAAVAVLRAARPDRAAVRQRAATAGRAPALPDRRTRHRLPEAPPPCGPPPQASGAATATYDQRPAVFVDPAGGTGVFAPGCTNWRPRRIGWT